MERFFNTEGPIVPSAHYHIPPLSRIDLDGVLRLIAQRRYFVLHAPRQTGKTSALEALLALLNDSGDYACVYVNVEVGQSAREDVDAAMQAILNELALEARNTLNDDFLDGVWPATLERAGPHAALREVLMRWAEATSRPVVLFIDEVDSLVGDSLLAVLRQLRAGYRNRPRKFPQSIVLCGVRDVRDYRIRSSADNAVVLGGSAFNNWVERFQYKEAGPQLLPQAFLQRIVNGGGRVEREYGLGRMCTDLLIIWPRRDADGAQRVVVECKLLHKSLADTIAAGLQQTGEYMDRSAATEGHLVIFDRDEGRPWRDKVFRRDDAGGTGITVWGM